LKQQKETTTRWLWLLSMCRVLDVLF